MSDAAEVSDEPQMPGRRRRGKALFFMTLFQVLLGVGAGYVVLVLALQAKVIFPATRDVDRTPKSAYGWDYEEVRVPVGKYVTHAWFIPTPNARGVVLFSHGNAGNIAGRIESCSLFRDLGLDVLVYDYGGYGYSTGRPSEKRCYEDIRAMWRYLTEERGVAPDRIVLFGRSLGGGPTADLAATVTPAAVILESTFTSTAHLAHDLFPWLPLGPLVRHRFNNAAKVSRITAPVLIVHSVDDDLIPIKHGRELFRLAPEPKQFLEIQGNHNDGFVQSKDLWLRTFDAFLTPLLPR